MNAEMRQLDGWVLRQRTPEGPGPHPLMLLLHGWTGDENAMWIFANRLPKNVLLVAPRGIYPTALGGYSWQPALILSIRLRGSLRRRPAASAWPGGKRMSHRMYASILR